MLLVTTMEGSGDTHEGTGPDSSTKAVFLNAEEG